MRVKIFFAMACICAIGGSTALAQQTAKITSSGIGYLEYLPQDYKSNTNDYPIVIFLHGIGERGTTSTDPATLLSSVQRVANVGLAKYVKYGSQYPFIIISPQLKGSYGTWPANYVMDVLNHVKKYLRINERRIYITGLSLGGFGTWTTLAAYPEVFAAAVPICSGGSALSKACVIAGADIPLWAFHGTADKVVSYSVTTNMINAVNACTPKPDPLAKMTLFDGDDHSIWDRVYQQTSAISWMTSFTNGTTTTSPAPAPEPAPAPTNNTPPNVKAGSDISVSLPISDVYIQSTAWDTDGKITSYKWARIAGGSIGMTNTAGSRLRLYNIAAGTYTFRVTVTDDKGATASDDVNVTVSGGTTTSPEPAPAPAPDASTNASPNVNAGSDISASSSVSDVYIQSIAWDTDGSIKSYKWDRIAGGSIGMTNTAGSRLRLYNIAGGTYSFRVTVTDDKGATASDDVNVTISGGSTATNSPPVAYAGADKTISTTWTTVQGSGSDRDGNIVSYRWEQHSGSTARLSNTSAAKVTVGQMTGGTYTLKLTVTDDKGATAVDYVNITVTGS